MSATPSYLVGQAVLVELEVRDRFGSLADPADIVVRVQRPDGEVEEVAADRAERGRYIAEVLPTPEQTGTWSYRAESTDPTTADEGRFRVMASRFGSGG